VKAIVKPDLTAMEEFPTLDGLIAAAAAGAATDEPLARLAAAARARDELEQLTEAVLDHFVTEARDAGCSWSQIGGVLGVSKQAAQQRHTAPESVARQLLSQIILRRRATGRAGLFTRFAPGARTAIALARDAAHRLRHRQIGTEHLLLGLLAEEHGTAARVLTELGATEAAVELAIVDRVGVGDDELPGRLPFAARSKKVLELALREAVRLRHDRIGTEHLLLGVLRDGGGLAVDVLTGLGIEPDRVRQAVLDAVGEAA
jgi:hypothetical protein